jgi:hypothetical protein
MVKGLIWWAGQALIAVFSLGFLLVGIDLCRAAFHLKDPYQFILTLFASNLVILISAVFCAGVVVRVISRLRGSHAAPSRAARENEPEAPDRYPDR